MRSILLHVASQQNIEPSGVCSKACLIWYFGKHTRWLIWNLNNSILVTNTKSYNSRTYKIYSKHFCCIYKIQSYFFLPKTSYKKSGHTLLNSMCDMLVIYLFNVKYITGLYLRTCRCLTNFVSFQYIDSLFRRECTNKFNVIAT